MWAETGGKPGTVEYHQERPKQPSGNREAIQYSLDRQQETQEQRLGNFLGNDVRCREAWDFGGTSCCGVEPGRMQGGFDRGTVGIFRKLRLEKQRPWNLRPGNRGTVEVLRDAVGKRGELPWQSRGVTGDGKQDWSWRTGTTKETTPVELTITQH